MDRRLTDEEVVERFRAAAYSTARPDRARTENAVAILYGRAGLDVPEITWGRSPREACLAADEAVGVIECDTFPGDRIEPERSGTRTRDEISHLLLPWLPCRRYVSAWPLGDNGGSRTAYPEALWRAIGFGHGLKVHPAHLGSFRHDMFADDQRALMCLVENVGWWRFHRAGAFLSERPSSIVVDYLGRPHSTDGPAVRFRDGWSVYAVDGIRVPGWTVEHPERIEFTDIDRVVNTEIRRVLATLTGDRYIESRGTLDHVDRWGELWSIPGIPGGLLKVTDATPRPDGTRRTYWLRVPEGMTSAHEAVAWTFGLEPDAYHPIKQT